MKTVTSHNISEQSPHHDTLAMVYGVLGVTAFSLTLPVTRVAVAYLDPVFIGLGRGVAAGLLSAVVLFFAKEKFPREHLKSLLIVAFGVTLGFPLLSAWAMKRVSASHGVIVIAILPLATAVAGAIRAGERPSIKFWIASTIGSLTVLAYALITGDGTLQWADVALLAAAVAAAFAYAEGGHLARQMAGWKIISWALVLATPVIAVPVVIIAMQTGLDAPPIAWVSFAYVSLFSQFLAFFVWYKGLAMGGVARVGQVQLLQPFLSLLASAVLLGERISLFAIGTMCLVMTTVAIGRKAAVERNPIHQKL